VAVLWGLELILRAFENKVIPEAKALSLAHTLGENNPKITEALIRQFEERLAEIKNNLCSI
jgi:DNA topoisomerase IA